MIKIFKCSDKAEDILEETLRSGITGIAGSRVNTRKLAGKVYTLAVSQELENIYAGPTYNHPEGELAYVFETDSYGSDEAMKLVIEAYDSLLEQEDT